MMVISLGPMDLRLVDGKSEKIASLISFHEGGRFLRRQRSGKERVAKRGVHNLSFWFVVTSDRALQHSG